MSSVLATIAKLLPRTHTLALLRYAVVDLVLTVLSTHLLALGRSVSDAGLADDAAAPALKFHCEVADPGGKWRHLPSERLTRHDELRPIRSRAGDAPDGTC